MFGISYGELFFIIGVTAAFVGPKDLSLIVRTAGRLAGRAIGYVQLARGQFHNVMYQSQAGQVTKEVQDAMQQLEAIRLEIRSVSFINPGPLTRKLMDNPPEPTRNHSDSFKKSEEEHKPIDGVVKDLKPFGSIHLHSQATAYARLAESEAVKSGSLKIRADQENFNGESVLFTVLPVSAESTGMLPNRKDSAKGSDILLEAVLESEVARNAKDFFSQPQNQIKMNEKKH